MDQTTYVARLLSLTHEVMLGRPPPHRSPRATADILRGPPALPSAVMIAIRVAAPLFVP
ncbi:hypothetical protein OE88DRAFT_1654625 [Heliocybe sulcata]|uniref:Uncharacterized protein n=1 Tax=Heliocybe sulcata TaxID=5364 RepID=A0A5C3N8V3_9AGAM|nr:hypothetical protein OE88DRAFT_1654625 [Heliocybe sulcata]